MTARDRPRPRFPLPAYPTGWFQVAWSAEVAPGSVRALQCFGRELVLLRGAGGEPRAFDAFCPHLGAHLGHGGRLEGEELVCPYHAWRYDATGRCTRVPYHAGEPPAARLQRWPVLERNGLIMVWHDVDGRAPLWDIPALAEFSGEGWSEVARRQWRFRTHVQEMAENMVDVAHFHYLHKTANLPRAELRVDGPCLFMRANTVSATSAGDLPGTLEMLAHGFGFSFTRFTGVLDRALIGGVVPVDEEHVDVRFSFVVRSVGGASTTKGMGKTFVDTIAMQLEDQDRPIWETKTYRESPTLCAGDATIGVFRRWCRQFYPEWYYAEAAAAYHGERGSPRR